MKYHEFLRYLESEIERFPRIEWWRRHHHEHHERALVVFFRTNHNEDLMQVNSLLNGGNYIAVLLFLAADGAGVSAPAFTTPPSWDLTGPATVTPAADGLSASVVATGDGTLTGTVSASGPDGTAYTAQVSIPITDGAAVTMVVQFSTASVAAPTPAPVTPPPAAS